MGVTYVSEGQNVLQKKTEQKAGMSNAVREEVDMYAVTKKDLDKVEAKAKTLKKRVDLHAGVLRKYTDDIGSPSDEPVTLEGEHHTVQLTARPMAVSSVDMDRVISILGPDVFMKIAKIGITDLRKYLTPEQFDEVAEEGHTGTRRIKVID